MAHCPSVNSQLIRCAADPNTARHQRPPIHYTIMRGPGLNVRHITTRFTRQGKWKADLCKQKANKPQRRGNLLRPILTVTPMKRMPIQWRAGVKHQVRDQWGYDAWGMKMSLILVRFSLDEDHFRRWIFFKLNLLFLDVIFNNVTEKEA